MLTMSLRHVKYEISLFPVFKYMKIKLCVVLLLTMLLGINAEYISNIHAEYISNIHLPARLTVRRIIIRYTLHVLKCIRLIYWSDVSTRGQSREIDCRATVTTVQKMMATSVLARWLLTSYNNSVMALPVTNMERKPETSRCGLGVHQTRSVSAEWMDTATDNHVV